MLITDTNEQEFILKTVLFLNQVQLRSCQDTDCYKTYFVFNLQYYLQKVEIN